jgi:two-component system response regulator MprA
MPQSNRILIIDDHEGSRLLIRTLLKNGGYRVLEAVDGMDGLEKISKQKPDLVILDAVMPNRNGFEVAAELRHAGNQTPVLMLTHSSDVSSRVKGLIAGADDYLPKPFDHSELLARVHALLRRWADKGPAAKVLHFGDLTVDLTARKATRAGKALALTRTEYDLLDLLGRHLGHPVRRDTMLQSVWGYTYIPNTRTVDTHIWRLRKKLGDSAKSPQWLRNVPGEGYALFDSEN